MKRWLSIAAVALAIGVLNMSTPADAQNNADKRNPTPEEWRAAQASYMVESLKRPDWKVTLSGMQYHVVKAVPNAPKPAPGSEVTVHYEGRLVNGVLFDSSYERKETMTFSLGRVIRGWQEGVPMMGVGETWEFVIPANLAYGEGDRDPIPGGSALRFKIELIAATTPVK